VARVELSPAVFDGFERILDHLARFDVVDTQSRIGRIVEAVQILTHSPLIGRPVRGGSHELVIGRGSHVYKALYRFVASVDTVFVLAIRSQREDGYERES
jgi:toxin ParE1/3/4